MEGWRYGGMEGWRDGGMEGWSTQLEIFNALKFHSMQFILHIHCLPIFVLCTAPNDRIQKTRVALATCRASGLFERGATLEIDAAGSVDSSLSQRASGSCLFAFWGSLHVTEFTLRPLKEMHKFTLPSKMRFFTVGRVGGVEILFATLEDETLRSFSIEATGALQPLSQVTLKSPSQLLWLQEREQLLVVETDEKTVAHSVRVLSAGAAGRSLERLHSALSAHLSLNISCWCLHGASLFCFDYNKKEIVQVDLL